MITCVHNEVEEIYRFKMGDNRFDVPYSAWDNHDAIRDAFSELTARMCQTDIDPRIHTCEACEVSTRLFFKLQTLMLRLGMNHFESRTKTALASEGSVFA